MIGFLDPSEELREKGAQPFIPLKFTPEDAWKHLHPEALRKTQLLFDYFQQDLADEGDLKALKFYLANEDDKELEWLYPSVSKATSPFVDLDLQENDLKLEPLFHQLDIAIIKIKLKWGESMEKARVLYFKELDGQMKEDEERLAALAKEEEEERKRREEEAEKVRREEEYWERWRSAYIALDPPKDDVRKYFPSELEKFEKATWEAVEVYMEEGKLESGDGAFNYRWYLKKIDDEREKERQQAIAKSKATEYNQHLNEAIDELKPKLHADKQNADKYFDKDNHFPGQKLNSCLTPSEKEELLEEIKHRAGGKLKSLVPEEYLDFISWKNTYYYRLRPIALYTFEGIPCLMFSFEVDAVVQSEIQLMPDKRIFGGYRYSLPVMNHNGYSAALQEPRLLGYFYQYLSPTQLPPITWQAIPISLLKGLMDGKLVPQGAKVLDELEAEIIYEVRKFDELVNIPASLRAWLREIQRFDAMAEAGVINNQTAQLITEQSPELKLVGLETLKSKKAKAFQLFSQGKRPSDPEVKTLGLKPASIYRYYQDWKGDIAKK